MPGSLPEGGAKLTLDASQWEQQFKSVIGDAAKLDALNPTVKVGVEDADLKTAAGLAADLDGAAPNIKVNADTAELDSTIDLLEQIRTMAVIDLALNFTGSALSVIQSLPGLGQALSNDNATAILQAFGEFNPEELAIAQNLFANNMVESVEAGALLLNQLKSFGIGEDQLEAAANGAVNAAQAFLAVGQEADSSAIAVAAHQLVINGLAKDYNEAADIIATGVGSGLNQRDDFLDTIIEYSSTFREAGFSAGEFLATLNSGLESGFDNTDRVADLFREFSLRAFNVEETAAQDSLKALGLGDEAAAFQAGEISGAEFFNGVVSAIQKEADPAKQQAFGANIFGTQFEDFGMMTVFGLDPIDEAFDTIEGRAAEISTLLNDTIGNTFTELFNTINLAAADLLSSDALDLDGKIQALKDGVTKAVDILQEGGSLGEALEISFGIEGVDTALLNIERVFGQFVIAILEVVAALQDPLGINDNDKGTRAEIARLAGQQLAFDLKVANPDEVAGIVDQAAARGVTNLGGAFNTAMDELISEGSFDQAQSLLDAVINNSDVSPEAAKTLSDKWNKAITDAQATVATGTAAMPSDVLARLGLGGGDEPGGMFSGAITAFEDVIGKSDETKTTVETNATAMATAAQNADLAIATALTGNTVTQSFIDVSSAANSSFPSVINWMGETGQAAAAMDIKVSGHVQHMLNLLKDLQFLSAQVATGVQQALAAGAGLGGTTNNTTNNVEISINSEGPGFAASVSQGYSIGRSLRGF